MIFGFKKEMLFCILLFSSITGYFPTALAGNESSGGGKGVMCKNSLGQITSVEVLDIYEGKHLYGLRYENLYAKKTTLEIVDEVVAHIKRFAMGRNNSIDLIQKSAQKSPRFLTGGEPKPINDAHETFNLPPNCSFVQIATVGMGIFSTPTVSKFLWNRMDALNRAALLLHESFYSMEMMIFGLTRSDRVRANLAFAFSKYDFSLSNPEPEKERSVWCVAPEKGIYFRAYEESCTSGLCAGTKTLRLYYDFLGGFLFGTQKGIIVPFVNGAVLSYTLDDLLMKKDFHSNERVSGGLLPVIDFVRYDFGPNGLFITPLTNPSNDETSQTYKLECEDHPAP